MTISRRTMLGAMAATGVASRASGVTPPTRVARSTFLFGVATAAHQIEGNNINSDYWVLENIPSTGFKDRSGDACDSWERWREDIAAIKAMGLNIYRFSVEWARIEPDPGQFSAAALDHYRRLCAACREAGITPMVTFHHFTSPRWIAARGGWEAIETADRFAAYCERTARAIGDLLDWACTLNEPNGQVTSYIYAKEQPFPREAQIRAEAARAVGSDRFNAFFAGNALKVRDTVFAAHAKGTAAIKSAAPKIKTGMTLALQELRPAPGGEAMYQRLFKEARQAFYDQCAKDDFVGVQPYMRLVVGADGYLPAKDTQATMINRTGADVSPAVLSAVIREVHAHCAAPIMITENGIDTLDDRQRIAHLTASLAGVERCVRDGIPVLGYIHWSLIDNFEWSSGYAPRMGLLACDRTTFKRTPKSSAAAYARLARDYGARLGRPNATPA